MGWAFVDLNPKFAQPILGPWANLFHSNLVGSGTMPSLILTDMLIDLEAKAPSKLSRKKPCKEKTRESRSEKLQSSSNALCNKHRLFSLAMQWAQTPSVTTGKNSVAHSQAMRSVKDALGPVLVTGAGRRRAHLHVWLQRLAQIHTKELLKTRCEGPEEHVSVCQV